MDDDLQNPPEEIPKLLGKLAAMDDTVRQLSTQLNGTWWKGADADAFRARWDGELRAQITKVSGCRGVKVSSVAEPGLFPDTSTP